MNHKSRLWRVHLHSQSCCPLIRVLTDTWPSSPSDGVVGGFHFSVPEEELLWGVRRELGLFESLCKSWLKGQSEPGIVAQAFNPNYFGG
jgi:hypothetical protein